MGRSAGHWVPTTPCSLAGWDAVVALESTASLRRRPRFVHLLVILRMVQERPNWVWEPAPIFWMRVGIANSLAVEMGGDLTRYYLETAADQIAIWSEFFGRGSPSHRHLLRRCHRDLFTPLAIGIYKAQPEQPLRDDGQLLRCAVAWFWRLPTFWALSFPILLVPHRVVTTVAAVLRPAAHGWRRRRARASAGNAGNPIERHLG